MQKKSMLFLLVFVLPILVSGCTSSPVQQFNGTLRTVANERSLFVGALLESKYFGDAEYLRVHAQTYNLAVAGEELKMTRIAKKGEGQFDFAGADLVVSQAEKQNQTIHAHVLVYHNAIPGWLDDSYSKDEMMRILENYVRTVVRRYKGRISIWDVTNELWDNDNGQWKDKLFYRVLGPDYPKFAFQWAHEEDPDAELILNGNEYQQPGPGLTIALATIRQWKSEGVPIDGIGLQMHTRLDVIQTIGMEKAIDGFKTSLQAFADLGLRIHITELDIAIDKPVTQEKLELQASLYKEILMACLAQPQCVEFNTWGFTDKYSWINTHPVFEGRYAEGLPFDQNLAPKPAYFALYNTLMNT